VLWGPELVQVYNDGYRLIMGDKHPAGLGQPTRDSWPEVWHLNAPIYARVRDGATVTLDDTLYPITRHGYREDAYFTLCYSPLRDVAGAIAGVLVTVFETTAAVRARALEAERARLAAALAAGKAGLLEEVFRRSPAFLHVLRGPDLVFELANDAYYQLVGHRELLGLPAFVALPEAAAGGFPERLAHVLATGEPFVGRELPVTLARTPGAPPEERLIDLVCLPLRDADGACTRILGHGVDVTEQVRARRAVEAAVRGGEARFRGFAEHSADTLWIVDADTGALEYLSPAYERMWGEPRDAVLRDLRHWGTLVHPDDRAEAARALPGALAGTADVGEYRIVRPADGAVRWVRDTGFPIRDAAGAVRRVGGIAQDITADKEAGAERERLLAAEREAREAAEAAVRARDTFLSIAAHELRTPLTALKGTVQLLRRQQARGTLGPDRLAAALATLDRSADRLVALTDDLLDVARLRTGHLRLVVRPIDLAALVGAAVGQARERAGDGHRLTLDAPAALPPVLADAGRVEQVLTNLLDNALKYAPTGGVVAVTVRAEGAGVAVAVRRRSSRRSGGRRTRRRTTCRGWGWASTSVAASSSGTAGGSWPRARVRGRGRRSPAGSRPPGRPARGERAQGMAVGSRIGRAC